MVTWTNNNLTIYHGTDDRSASAILSSGVDLAKCSPLTDFGRGFYATTNLEQAKNWAILRAIRMRPSSSASKGTVIEMNVSRDWLSNLSTLAFVRAAPESGFADFVRFCRSGGTPHRLADNYDLVYGPVAMWQDLTDPNLVIFIIDDCDQISFHSSSITDLGSPLFADASTVWAEP